MNDTTTPAATLAATLARLDVRVWADKSIRDFAAIAGRTSGPGQRTTVDPARVDAVLALLIERLEAERQALAERGETTR